MVYFRDECGLSNLQIVPCGNDEFRLVPIELGGSLAVRTSSSFAPQKSVNETFFRAAKRDN